MGAAAPALLAQSPTVSDGFDPNVNGQVNAMAVQADGKIVIAGTFTAVQPNEALTPTARNFIARINADGSVDTTFDPHPNNQVLSMAVQTDGKIVIGGNFTTLQPNGAASAITRNHIARLNADGTVDAGFDPNAQGTLVSQVFAMALQPNGQIVIGGAFKTFAPNGSKTTISQPNLARLNTDGTVDTGFAPDPLATVTALAIQPNGQIVVGGAFTSIAFKGQSLGRNHVARFNADGSFDFGFDPNCNGTINTIAIQQDGKILLGGNFTTLQPDGATTVTTRDNFARLNPDGTLDVNFAPNPSSTVNAMLVQRDNRIILGGTFFQIFPGGTANGTAVNHMARLNADGTLDTTFSPSTNGIVASLALQVDGKVLIGGNFTQVFANAAVATTTRNNMARVNPDGTLDATFNPDSSGRVLVIAKQADGKVLLGGNFTSFGGVTSANIARMQANGTFDPGFAPEINGPVTGMAVQSDGKILIVGNFTDVNGISRSNIARLNADGTLDTAYNPNPNGPVVSMALQSDGRALIAGSFTGLQPNSQGTVNAISEFARINTDGTVDTTINIGADSRVNAVVVQSDGKFVVGGEFTFVTPNNGGAAPTNGTVTSQRNFIARFNSNGSLDTSFDPEVNNSVNALALGTNGQILAGGAFNTVSPGLATNVAATVYNIGRLARLNSDGSLDTKFNPNFNQSVLAIGVQPDGHIIAVGNFGTVNPNQGVAIFSRSFVARINSDGSLDQNFNPQPNGNVNSLLANSDGSFYLGGGFTAIQSTLTNHLALFNSNATLNTSFLPQSVGVSGNTLNAIAVQPDNKVVIAGSFNAIAGATSTNVARFNADSSPDFSFNSNTDGAVNAVAVLAAGSNPSLPQDPNIAWLAATGALRAGFAGDTIAQINGTVNAAVVQSDGSLVVGGNFHNNSGVTANNLMRLTPSGKLDSTYNPTPNNLISGMVIQPDGKVIIVGSFTTLQPNQAVATTSRNYIARLNTDGTVDTNFDPNANAPISCIALQPDGKILIGGSFTTLDPNGSTTFWVREHFARLNTDGTVDQGFNPNLNGPVDAVFLQSNGQILLGGAFTSLQPNGTGNNITRNNLARINADGTLDQGFDPEPSGLVAAVLQQSDGKIVFGGVFAAVQPNLGTSVVTRNNLARVNPDGSVDMTYDPNVAGGVEVLTLAPNGEIFAGGTFAALKPNGAILPTTREHLALLNTDGTVDPSFDPSPNGAVGVILRQSDGSVIVGGSFSQLQPTGALYIGGSFSHVASVSAPNLSLLNADGSPNTNFTAIPNGAVDAIAVQSNGQAVVAGSFTSVAGTARGAVARLNADNTLDTSFNPNANGTVNAVALQADGKIVLAGSFGTVGGAARPSLARISSSGSLDAAFVPTVNGTVDAVAVQANGQIVLAGSFTNVSGSTRNNLARLNSDGSLDAAFNPNVNGAVNAVALQANGQIILGGSFSTVGGQGAVDLARINADGSFDSSFNASTDGTVSTLALESDGKLFLGGAFAHVNGLTRFRFARLGATTGATQSLIVNGSFTGVTWSRGGSAPELSQVAVQVSTDENTWTSLGTASRVAGTSNWQLTGVTLPANTIFYLRTLGVAPTSQFGSASLVETVGSFDSGTSFVGSSVGETPSAFSLSSGSGQSAAAAAIGATGSTASTDGSASGASGDQASASARLVAFTSRAGVSAASPISAGFTISGSAPKNVLVRGVGPGLGAFGVTDAIANPVLQLRDAAGNLVVANAGWNGDSALATLAAQTGAFPLTPDSADAAASAVLPPGSYTLQVSGANGQAGSALAEVYDADSDLTSPQQIAAVSSRAQVSTGASLVGGFVVANGSHQVLIRAVGPSLADSGTAAPLAAPVLNLYDARGNLLARNGGWSTQATVNSAYPAAGAAAVAAAAATAGAAPLPAGSGDAAIVVALPPGAYAVEVTTADGQPGTAAIEIYKF